MSEEMPREIWAAQKGEERRWFNKDYYIEVELTKYARTDSLIERLEGMRNREASMSVTREAWAMDTSRKAAIDEVIKLVRGEA
jgi:hypothetical protein